jgi:DNA-binding transcriptional ArsR family regulator
MTHARTQTIREFILDQAATHPRGLARRVAEAYGISRQAANRHLDLLVEAGLLEQSGQTRARTYRLRRTSSLTRELRVTPVLNPNRVWEDHIASLLAGDRPAFQALCRGAFGELVRNAIADSGASWITFSFSSNARHVELNVSDDGEGIFQRLQARLGATTPHDAAEMIANLANARANDSPAARLVLLARNFPQFSVRSSGTVLTFDRNTGTWSVRNGETARQGTSISFQVRRHDAALAEVPARQRETVAR